LQKKHKNELEIGMFNAYIICMWRFTKHCLERLSERGYAKDEVLSVLDGDVPSFVYPSPKEESVDLYFGRVGEKFLMIPVDRLNRTIITVRPMRKGEKENYLREVKNG
jgi:hypothetical protein